MEHPRGVVDEVPAVLRERVGRILTALAEQPESQAALAAASERVRASSARVLACSDFVASACARDPAFLPALFADPAFPQGRPPHQPVAAPPLTTAATEADVLAALRRWRRHELVRIAWRELAGWASVEESLRDLSAFADAAIAWSCAFAYQTLAARYGKPRSANGVEQQLVVLGMGKLGGRELNFSSDIDLVFLFAEHGDTDGARPIWNEEFFTRQGRLLIRLLDALTHDGFVFRVDMRLRPFGDSGPLVMSFSAFENYLQQHGRDWERYAYVKARALTAAAEYAGLYNDVVRPFVYRRYLDFGVFEALREMKALIAREVARRELRDNVKLGPGGIREIEFIVQSFQLLRGGTDRRLQSQSLLGVLPLLAGQKLLPSAAVLELHEAYLFLRRLENRLQMLNDEQQHTLPQDDAERARVAFGMGSASWQALAQELERYRNAVTRHFQLIMFGPEGEPTSAAPVIDFEALWGSEQAPATVQPVLARIGLKDAETIAALLLEWRGSSAVQRLDESGRRRLQNLMPRLLLALRAAHDQPAALRRVLMILEAIGGRSVYLALLNENAAARERLIAICDRSEFLTRQIAAFPLLLDELIDARIFEELPTREQFAAELTLRLAHAPDSDPERQVEALRQFQRAAVFRVALADLTGRLPLMRVSDRLTDIAELILEQVLAMAWQQMVELHGAPMYGNGVELAPAGIAIIGYGKLGALELGYASDLDLVFLHDSRGDIQRTAGAKAVDNSVFFLRLGQRILHLLTLHSAAGRLYEVDVRLRPSGKGGLMVTQLDAFHDYQKSEAWTWEHQALLRARAVAGTAHIRERFEEMRLDVVCHHVRRDSLREEVRRMRERMRAELSRAKSGEFDVKQDPGGIADIEFLAQYWTLRWADRYPPLATFPDTIRQLESVASANLIPQATVDRLTAIYREYRSLIHHRALENEPPVVKADEFAGFRQQVIAIWNETMSDAPARA